jgi:hypothetical protein
MARLYVVAFLEKNRRVRYLANPLICVYNPDSPSGPPLGLTPSSFQLSLLDYEPVSWAQQVIYEHEHFKGRVPSLPVGDGRADRGKMQNFKFAKVEISKIVKSQNQNLENFHRTSFPRDRSRNCFPQDHNPVLRISGKTFTFSLLVLHSQCVRCVFNASKQCPHEATTFYLAEQPR